MHFAAHDVDNKDLLAIQFVKNAAGRLYNLTVR